MTDGHGFADLEAVVVDVDGFVALLAEANIARMSGTDWDDETRGKNVLSGVVDEDVETGLVRHEVDRCIFCEFGRGELEREEVDGTVTEAAVILHAFDGRQASLFFSRA